MARLPSDIARIIKGLPMRLDRKQAAEVIARHFFPISSRTLETWPLEKKLLMGRATFDTRALVQMAYEKMRDAPPPRDRLIEGRARRRFVHG